MAVHRGNKRVLIERRSTEKKRIVRTEQIVKLVSWEVVSDSISRVRS
jgi:hypothetical protein